MAPIAVEALPQLVYALRHPWVILPTKEDYNSLKIAKIASACLGGNSNQGTLHGWMSWALSNAEGEWERSREKGLSYFLGWDYACGGNE
ncbi:hypothetical protein TNCV_1826181 [Trichonephila clavipes]|nr:hypothetical protein TNCV_1826181 [Trichonephila clavipes]